MDKNIQIKKVPKYLIFEKEIVDENILDDLIEGNKSTQISFSYETEAIIKFMYYCLNYFFKNQTYGEKLLNIELYDNKNKNNSYLFKFKLLLPYLFKIIIRYLSINKKWFNFIFNGLELLNLINFLDTKNYSSFNYNSLLHYLLNVKYKLIDNQMNLKEVILYNSSFNFLINGISEIISDILYFNRELFQRPKEEIINLFGEKNKISCQVCKLFPTNLIYFKCGHYFCYYCYFYNSKIINNQKILNDKCFFCNNNIINI